MTGCTRQPVVLLGMMATVSLADALAIEPSASAGAAQAEAVAAAGTTRAFRIPGTTAELVMAWVPQAGQAGLWVSTTEISWDLYDVYLYKLDEPEGQAAAGEAAGPDGVDAVSRPSKPYVPPDRGLGHDGFAAIGMTIDAARAFCVWLEARTGITARLPTPEEWTTLALAGSEPPYCVDEESQSVDSAAWHAGVSGGRPRAVGTLAPNGAGLFDVHGNVAEWVQTEERRPVAMGGSFRDDAAACTAESRQQQDRSWNQSDPQVPKSRWWLADCSWVGFRIVAQTVPGVDTPASENRADREDDHAE